MRNYLHTFQLCFSRIPNSTFICVFLLLLTNNKLFSQNLIINGGAELLAFGELVGWTEVSGTNWTRGTEVPRRAGNYHFYADLGPLPGSSYGSNQAIAELRQDISVATYTTSIDAGTQAFEFVGYTRSFDDKMNDLSQIVVEYYDAGMNLLTNWDSGPQDFVGTGNADPNGWLELRDVHLAPIGTRTIRIRLISTRLHGDRNDGYYDALSLTPVCLGGESSISSATLCEGVSATLSLQNYSGSIQWQQSINGGAWTNLGVSNNSNSIVVSPLISNSPLRYRARLTSGTCSSFSSISDLTINPPAESGAITPSSNSLCEGEILDLSLSGHTGTVRWQVSRANDPFLDFGTSTTTQQLSPTTTDSPLLVRVIATLGLCVDTSTNSAVTIFPNAVGGNASASISTICEGQSSTIKLNGSSGNVQWQERVYTGNWVNVGTNADSVVLSPLYINSPVQYRALLSAGSCSDISTVTTITINEAAESGTSSVLSNSLCEGESTTLSLVGNNGIIQWQQSYAGGSWNTFGNSSPIQTIGTSIANSPAAYRAIVSLGICSDTSNITEVSIYPTAEGGTVSAVSRICDGETTSLNLSGSTGTIRWQEKIVGGVWNYFGGINATQLTNPSFAASPVEYRAVLQAGSCSDTSSIHSIIVEEAAVGGNSQLTQTSICDGKSTVLSLSGYRGVIQWQASYNGLLWLNFGTNNNSQSVAPTLAQSTTEYRAVVTHNNCLDTSSVSTISVQPNAVSGNAAIFSDTICNGDETYLYTIGETGTLQWQESYNGLTWNDLSNQNPTIVAPTLPNTAVQYRVISRLGSCTDTSLTLLLTVFPTPTVGVIVFPDTVCTYSVDSLTLVGNTGSIQWQQASAGSWTNFGTGQNREAIPSTSGISPFVYRVMVSNAYCKDSSDIVSVEQIEAIAGISSLNTNEVCAGSSVELSLSGENASFIQWQEQSSGGNWTDFGNNNPIQTISASTTGQQTYRAVVRLGSRCTDTSSVSTLTISPTPAGGIVTISPDSICDGSSTSLSLNDHTGNIQWQRAVNRGAWTNFGSGNSTETVNPSFSDVFVHYRAILALGNCTDTSSLDSLGVIAIEGGSLTSNTNDICEGSQVNLSLSGNIGNIQWQQQSTITNAWENLPLSGSAVTVSPSAAESVANYRVFVQNSICSDVSSTISITISPTPAGGTVTISPDSICDGSSTSLSLNDHTGNIQWQRAVNRGAWTNFGSGSSTETVNPSFSDVFVHYRAILALGNCTDTSSLDSLGVIAIAGGIALANDTRICHGESTTISLGGHTGSIQWQRISANNTIEIIGETTNTLTVSPEFSTSSAIYRAMVRNSFCIDSSSYAFITIDTLPFNVSAIVGVDTLCGNASHRFSISGVSNADDYIWTTDAGIISRLSPETIEITATNTNNTSVTLSVSGINNCGTGSTTSLNLVILAEPDVSILNSDTTICEYDTVILLAVNSFGVFLPEMSFQWYFNNQPIPSVNAAEHTATAAGNYTLEVTNSGKCNTMSSNDVTVTVVEMTIDAGEDIVMQRGESATINAYSFENYAYNWSPDVYIADVNTLTPNVSPLTSTIYTLTATSSEGCVATDSVSVIVVGDLEIPTAFSPNGDGTNDTWVIKNLEMLGLQQLSIFNRWGNKVFETSNASNQWDGTRNGNPLPVGTYYYIITLKNAGTSYTGALTIVR